MRMIAGLPWAVGMDLSSGPEDVASMFSCHDPSWRQVE